MPRELPGGVEQKLLEIITGARAYHLWMCFSRFKAVYSATALVSEANNAASWNHLDWAGPLA